MYMKSQVITLKHLETLVRNANHPQIRDSDELTAALFGRQRTAAVVFRHLMRWLPYSKRADGAIYKSAEELAKAARCSTKSVERVRKLLEKMGFDLFVKKANGAPTTHFRQNAEKLLRSLAAVFETTIGQIRDWMYGQNVEIATDQNVEIQSGQSDEKEIGKMSKSITIKDSNKPQQEETETITTDAAAVENPSTEIEEIRCELQTSTGMIQKWIGIYGLARIREVLHAGKERQAAGKVKNLGAWVHAALKGGYTWEQRETAKRNHEQDGMRYVTGKYADFIDH